jgi:hypothetical protein
MNEGTPSANEPEIIIRSPREIRELEIYWHIEDCRAYANLDCASNRIPNYLLEHYED